MGKKSEEQTATEQQTEQQTEQKSPVYLKAKTREELAVQTAKFSVEGKKLSYGSIGRNDQGEYVQRIDII
jgi:hypothetical protein